MKYAKLCAIKNKSVRDIVKYDLQNPMWVTEALNRLKKGQHMVLNGQFSQPYSEYPVRARANVRSPLSLIFYKSVGILNKHFKANKKLNKKMH